MKINIKNILISLACTTIGYAQQKEETPNIVLITLDGFRWQELYSGADSLLITNTAYVEDTTSLKSHFWRTTPEERREVLLPFIWNTISNEGQLHGNRWEGSKVDVSNTMFFSYPGYNEILTGKADDARITSNDKINNPNRTILEQLNAQEEYKGKVAAFGSWDVFPFIINEERSGVPVNAGFKTAKGDNLSEKEKFLNDMQSKVPSPWGSVRLDAFTHYYALEYMKKNHPKFTFISYGETDDFAHDGDYEAYLKSAHTTDTLIKEVWEFCASDTFYKDNTLFIITTDHGRGTTPLETWKHHGAEIPNSKQVWLIALGKGVKAKGEVKTKEQLYSSQIAPTLYNILKSSYNKKEITAKPISLQ